MSGYKRYYIGAGATLITFFAVLQMYGLQIVDLSGDMVCAGTQDDPCISYFDIVNPTSKSIYIYNYDEVELEFSPDIDYYELYVKYYGRWHYTNFTKETRLGNIPKDRKYSFVFPRYSTKHFKLVGYKHNPTDDIKWGVGMGSTYLDPLWRGVGDTKVIIEFEKEPMLKHKPELDNIDKTKLIFTKFIGDTEEKIKDKKKIVYEMDIKSEHKNINLKIKNEYTHTMNGIATTINKEDWQEIEARPEVKKIWLDENLTIQLQDSVPLINADDVWQEQNASGNNITGLGIKVAIIDTGIDYTHDDLGNCTEAEFLAGTCTRIPYGYDYVNNDANPFDDSLSNHGTHCAGIVGANGTIKGVAPDVTLVAYKVCNSMGTCLSSNIISAIENATLYGVDIISMSLGGSGYSDDLMCVSVSAAFDAGINVVAASGNYGFENYTIGTPAACEKCTAVGSVDKSNIRAWSSSTDPALYSNNTPSFFKPDVMSYGVSINSTKVSDSYGELSGTSMAAPHVAGLIALMKQAHPLRNNEELESIISTNTEYMNVDGNLVGGGIADAILSYTISGLIIPNNVLFHKRFNPGIVNYTHNQIMNLTNFGNEKSIFSINIIDFSESDINASVSVSTLTLSPNESGTFNLSVFINESKADGRYHGYINISDNNTEKLLYVPFSIEKYYEPSTVTDITSWSSIDMGFPMGYHQTEIVGNKLYLFGGYNSSYDYANQTRYATIRSNGSLSEFQLATAILPVKMVFHRSTVLNNSIYSVGGFDWIWYESDPSNYCNSYINKTFYATPESGGDILIWNEGAELPVECTRNCGGVIALNNTIYYIGGQGYPDDVDTDKTGCVKWGVYYAFPGDNGNITEWHVAQHLPTGNINSGVTIFNDTIYILGGAAHTSEPSRKIYYAKPDADGNISSWTVNALDLPEQLHGGHSLAANGKIYFIEGYDQTFNSNTFYSKKVYYTIPGSDGEINYWYRTTDIPEYLELFSVETYNDLIYVIGGINKSSDTYSSTIYYNPTQLSLNYFNNDKSKMNITFSSASSNTTGVFEIENNAVILITSINIHGYSIDYNDTDYCTSGGIGTSEDPIVICDQYDLNNMRNNLGAYYILADNITLTDFNSGEGFLMIDNGSTFTGSLNGNGYSIINLFINRSVGYCGLFSNMYGNVSNLKLDNCSVHCSGAWNIGCLAGDVNYGGRVDNVSASGEVEIFNGNKNLGGLIGTLGGDGGGSRVNNSYCNVTVSGTGERFGGLCGNIGGGIVSNSYSIGHVSTVTDSGGFIGKTWGDTCSNNFYDKETSGHTISECATGKTTIEMKTQSNFTNWDFINTWNINEGTSYPYLISDSIHGTHKVYTVSPSIELNGTQIWNYSSTFNITNVTTSNFTIELQNEIDECESQIDNNCTIYFNITSDSVGIIGFSNLRVIYSTSTDSTSPTYSLNTENSTLAGTDILHSVKVTDETGLTTTGGYIFSFDNGTGSFTNDTWTAFSSNPDWSNVTKSVNTTVGTTIQWKVYANDTSDNWATSSTYSYTTTNAGAYQSATTTLDFPFTNITKIEWNSTAGLNYSTSTEFDLNALGFTGTLQYVCIERYCNNVSQGNWSVAGNILTYYAQKEINASQNMSLLLVNGSIDDTNPSFPTGTPGTAPYIAGMAASLLVLYYYRRRR